MVKGFPLKGLNIRASQALHSDLVKQIPNFNGIPRYLVIDAKGNVVDWDAKRPGDRADLLKQLEEYLEFE